ncbi:FeoB-associated Cys-rich membrane protein [Methanosarcinaceae archaeon]|nr:FeoB-associated Cys-rich membrane protein [Methanosarcinaceae archaeon]
MSLEYTLSVIFVYLLIFLAVVCAAVMIRRAVKNKGCIGCSSCPSGSCGCCNKKDEQKVQTIDLRNR